MPSTEFIISILVNLVVVAFFAGVYVHTIQTQGKSIEDLKAYFSEHLTRVEKKQDKHNNLIERMVIVEQGVKSAHHRIDEISK